MEQKKRERKEVIALVVIMISLLSVCILPVLFQFQGEQMKFYYIGAAATFFLIYIGRNIEMWLKEEPKEKEEEN